MKRKNAFIICGSIFFFLFLGKIALAATLEIDAIDSGSYDSFGTHYASQKAYRARGGSCSFRRIGYLVFDIPTTSGITSATLRLSVGSVFNVGISGTSAVHSSVSIAELSASHSGSDNRPDIFNNLTTGELGRNSGTLIGGGTVDIPLNSNAVNLLNTTEGQIPFSTYVIHATTGVCGTVFDNTGSGSTRKLILETQDLTEVTLTSPNTTSTYNPGDSVTLEWTTTGADADDDMVLSMKRDSASGLPEPDGVNWFLFTENTPNDGSEQVIIPPGLSEANDWHFFVRHAISDVFDASDEAFTYEVMVQPHTLTVTKSGTGSCTVTSAPAGIDCGADCTENYDEGTAVTLTATPDTGSAFTGWSDPGCSGTGICQVTMNEGKSLFAIFELASNQEGYSILFREKADSEKDGSWGLIGDEIPGFDHTALAVVPAVGRSRVYESHPGYPSGTYADQDDTPIVSIEQMLGVQKQHTVETFLHDAWVGESSPVIDSDEIVILTETGKSIRDEIESVIGSPFQYINYSDLAGTLSPTAQKGGDGSYTCVGLIEWASEQAGINGGQGFIPNKFEEIPIPKKSNIPLLSPSLLHFTLKSEEKVNEAKEYIQGLFDPVDFIITDPLGRRLGFSYETGELNEIPGTSSIRVTEI